MPSAKIPITKTTSADLGIVNILHERVARLQGKIMYDLDTPKFH